MGPGPADLEPDQLPDRGIAVAAAAGPVRVMLPMVTNVAEVRAAREIYERVARRLRRRNERVPDRLPPLGIMIETPGAALAAVTIRNPARPAPAAVPAGAGQRPLLHCGLDCPPARSAEPVRSAGLA